MNTPTAIPTAKVLAATTGVPFGAALACVVLSLLNQYAGYHPDQSTVICWIVVISTLVAGASGYLVPHRPYDVPAPPPH